MKKKWIWLLSALLLAVIILPAAAFANDPIELFADANKAEFKTAVLTVPEGQEVALWTTDPAGIAEVNNGTVTAKAAGTTVVRALAEDKDEGGNFTGYSVIDSWDIVVKNRTAVEIKVATMPTKLDTYVSGDKFDKAGMVVTVDFDSTETEVTTNYTVSPTTALSAGTQEITVTYTPKPELTASFNVTVQEVKLVDFIIVDPRDKFTVGDKLPEMGIEIELIYNNGKRQTSSPNAPRKSMAPSRSKAFPAPNRGIFPCRIRLPSNRCTSLSCPARPRPRPIRSATNSTPRA